MHKIVMFQNPGGGTKFTPASAPMDTNVSDVAYIHYPKDFTHAREA